MASSVIVVLVLGAIGLLTAPLTALLAKNDATAAARALSDNDLETAEDKALTANLWSSSSAIAANWWGGDLWSLAPVVGSAVNDLQRLTSALDELSEALGMGVDVAPSVMGDDADLVQSDGSVDLDRLEPLLTTADQAGAKLLGAMDSLREVEGDAPLVGETMAARAAEARGLVDPAAAVFQDLRPLLPRLPVMLGSEGDKRYLIALMNPSEQRYSGGGTLSFKMLHLRDGSVLEAETANTMNDKGFLKRIKWPKVEGNPFHRADQRYRLLTATLAPSWSVSGPELARAWRATREEQIDGVIALDVMVVQRLLPITGEIESPGLGTLWWGNLVERLVGSYDELTSVSVYEQRKMGEQQLMASFQEQLLAAEDKAAILDTLKHAADGRHFALWFDDEAAQEAVRTFGLDGDLSSAEHDYIGVFNQSLSGYKSDFWQRRTVNSEVVLREDGSATVRQTVRIHNDSPPEVNTAHPRYWFYTRRENDMRLGSFLPEGASVRTVSLEGEEVEHTVGDYYGRPYVQLPVFLDDQEVKVVVMEYDVPSAAEVVEGGLVYRLNIDPHALVVPQGLGVQVHLPAGYAPAVLPEGWRVEEGVLHWSTAVLDATHAFAIPLERDSGS